MTAAMAALATNWMSAREYDVYSRILVATTSTINSDGVVTIDCLLVPREEADMIGISNNGNYG